MLTKLACFASTEAQLCSWLALILLILMAKRVRDTGGSYYYEGRHETTIIVLPQQR